MISKKTSANLGSRVNFNAGKPSGNLLIFTVNIMNLLMTLLVLINMVISLLLINQEVFGKQIQQDKI